MTPYYQDNLVTLYYGDCRETLPQLIEVADFVLTDPPYGVAWQSNRRIIKHRHIQNDGNLLWVTDAYQLIFNSLKSNSLCFTFYGWPDADTFVSSWKSIGFGIKSHIVWVKSNIGLGWFTRGQHEVAYLLTKGSPSKPAVAISDVLFAEGTGNDFHPTQKPQKVCEQILNGYLSAGRLVLDPFSGVGTTLYAAKGLGIHSIGIEIEERYCEAAARRCEITQPALFTTSLQERSEQSAIFTEASA